MRPQQPQSVQPLNPQNPKIPQTLHPAGITQEDLVAAHSLCETAADVPTDTLLAVALRLALPLLAAELHHSLRHGDDAEADAAELRQRLGEAEERLLAAVAAASEQEAHARLAASTAQQEREEEVEALRGELAAAAERLSGVQAELEAGRAQAVMAAAQLAEADCRARGEAEQQLAAAAHHNAVLQVGAPFLLHSRPCCFCAVQVVRASGTA